MLHFMAFGTLLPSKVALRQHSCSFLPLLPEILLIHAGSRFLLRQLRAHDWALFLVFVSISNERQVIFFFVSVDWNTKILEFTATSELQPVDYSLRRDLGPVVEDNVKVDEEAGARFSLENEWLCRHTDHFSLFVVEWLAVHSVNSWDVVGHTLDVALCLAPIFGQDDKHGPTMLESQLACAIFWESKGSIL